MRLPFPLFISKKMMQQTVPVVKKLFHDGVMLRLFRYRFMDSIFCDLDDFGEWVDMMNWDPSVTSSLIRASNAIYRNGDKVDGTCATNNNEQFTQLYKNSKKVRY
ncbi:hypothetical protein [Psychrobacillus sp. BM2]|uniref:hypothetical protein n=1 Tax=Psychrobacillus sp. BM2 TaxID=3400421 RepID=UPI003B022E25